MALQRIKISGISMWPTFKDGDEIIFTDEVDSKIQGNIVLFKDHLSGELVTHRLIDSQITKGDRVYTNDDTGPIVIATALGNQRYFWGKKGQPFKRLISFHSKRMTKKSPFRYLHFALLVIVVQTSFLFCQRTKQSHT